MGVDTPSSEYTRLLTRMLFNEPSVVSAVQTLETHCLRHGVQLRWGYTPPTPSFERHIRQHYEPFCREALRAFLAVGFAAYRLRREGSTMVPELLPYGTYSWTVTRNPQARKRARASPYAPHPSHPPPEHEGPPLEPPHARAATPPLLRYDVTCFDCDDPIHVFAYATPHGDLTCYSALATLIPHYVALVTHRQRALAAEEWNTFPRMALEEKDENRINDVANTGAGVGIPHVALFAGMEHSNKLSRQEAALDLVAQTRVQVAYPEEATMLPAPKNNVIKTLDKVDPPSDMMKRELFFARAVMLALGLPPSLAMAGTSAIASSSGGGGAAWQESPEMVARALMDTCQRLARALEGLLAEVYARVYVGAAPDDVGGPRRLPTFTIPVAPSVPLEHLVPLFDAQLLDDAAYSRLFETAVGFPLSLRAAVAARHERHRAVNILPFKDKKDAPK